jgi:transketolase
LKLSRHAVRVRREVLTMHQRVQAGHIGTGLSCIDVLTYLYRHWLEQEDTFILSKGHGASALYATLHDVGAMTPEDFKTYYQDGSLLPAHPAARAFAAIPAATGSLGHGLPIANGVAYSRKALKKSPGRVVCLLSDGECDEGSVWEGALFAAHHALSNLTVVVDANGLQGFGRTHEVLGLEPFAAKWEAFGFFVREVDGHDFDALHAAFQAPAAERPLCIIARTVKGKGVSFLEDRLDSHYLPINGEQLKKALDELTQLERALGGVDAR